MVGTRETQLVVLRGNSGSGKTSVARAVQRRRGRSRVAVVSQDVVRRDVLWVDTDANPAVGLMDLMARFALDRGLSVVVEGILHPDRYGAMLTRLVHDHRGGSRAYFWDLPFAETVRRHGTKAGAPSFGEEEMRSWWYGAALVDGLDEQVVGPGATLEATVERIERDCGWA